jgi:hypothetical protein
MLEATAESLRRAVANDITAREADTFAASAALRVANAGLMLRRVHEADGITGMGIDEPTELGALLPK